MDIKNVKTLEDGIDFFNTEIAGTIKTVLGEELTIKPITEEELSL